MDELNRDEFRNSRAHNELEEGIAVALGGLVANVSPPATPNRPPGLQTMLRSRSIRSVALMLEAARPLSRFHLYG